MHSPCFVPPFPPFPARAHTCLARGRNSNTATRIVDRLHARKHLAGAELIAAVQRGVKKPIGLHRERNGAERPEAKRSAARTLVSLVASCARFPLQVELGTGCSWQESAHRPEIHEQRPIGAIAEMPTSPPSIGRPAQDDLGAPCGASAPARSR